MKLWGGRFEKNSDKSMNDFHSSISFDSRMYKQDIIGSIAHVKMLSKQGIIPNNDSKQIIEGLNEILKDFEEQKIQLDPASEDIHMFIEQLLINKVGEAGKKIHTGRSRNDQVALDIRLYLLEQINAIIAKIKELITVFIETAAQHTLTIMPGYTHMQKAQPITLAHHIMAYCEMFLRDIDRLKDCYKRTNSLPLGSGALAGSTYPLDREYVAAELGFNSVCQNSLDGVSDRDFCIEFCSASSITMMHLSRFCEELILWSSDEFKFVEMDDAYSTGSSIMPQKKNPDVAELIRGKTGRVYGDLFTLLTIMKSIPLAYNKDMQEDKEAVFDSIDTVFTCVDMFKRMFSTLKFNTQTMRQGASKGFTNATDAADYLVKKGMAFRDAHEVIGKMVLSCIKQNKGIEDLTLGELKAFSDSFEDDIFNAISLEVCVNERNIIGGPAQSAVLSHIGKVTDILNSL